VYQETHKRMMTSLNDPKLNQLIDELVELRTKHEELEDEYTDISYAMTPLDINDECDSDVYYEYEDLQSSLQDDMNKIEKEMKRLIEDYIPFMKDYIL
jgi:hypothetical protein